MNIYTRISEVLVNIKGGSPLSTHTPFIIEILGGDSKVIPIIRLRIPGKSFLFFIFVHLKNMGMVTLIICLHATVLLFCKLVQFKKTLITIQNYLCTIYDKINV